jgi:hypothetical protein
MTSDSKILAAHKERMLKEAVERVIGQARDLSVNGCFNSSDELAELRHSLSAYDALNSMNPEALAKRVEAR